MWYMEGERFDGIVAWLGKRRNADLQFIAVVRQDKKHRDAPIFVVAAEVDADCVKKLAELGITNIILAPNGLADIVGRIDRGLAPPKKKAESYDVRFINCFVAAAAEVLEFYLDGKPRYGKPALKRDAAGDKAFATGMIAFNGGSQMGSMSLRFDKGFLEALAKKTFGEGYVLPDAAAFADLAGEMCNQVLGKAKAEFGKINVKMQIGLPQVATAPQALAHAVANPVIMLPIQLAKAAGEALCILEFAMGQSVEFEVLPEEDKAETPVALGLWE